MIGHSGYDGPVIDFKPTKKTMNVPVKKLWLI